MTRSIIWTSQFKKDYKKMMKRHSNMKLIDDIIRKLSNKEVLPPVHKDHMLIGNWEGYRECHIEPDWLLIYKIDDDSLILVLTRTGTHSDLFGN